MRKKEVKGGLFFGVTSVFFLLLQRLEPPKACAGSDKASKESSEKSKKTPEEVRKGGQREMKKTVS